MKHRKYQRGGANDTPTDLWDMKNVTNVWDLYIKPVGQEQIRLLPDSLLFGSALLALLTQSFSMAIFFMSLVETAGVNAFFQSLSSYLDSPRTAPSDKLAGIQCRSGFVTTRLDTFSTLKASNGSSSFPSPTLFFISTASSYIISSLYSLKDELESLGPEYSARFYLALFATFFLLLTISFYRLYNGCEGMGIATLSLVLGGLLGVLLVTQNWYLFGKDSVNLIGVPLLRDRTADKKPIYVCPQKVSSI